MSFEYLCDKIKSASFRDNPFRYLYISDLIESRHFSELTSAPQIKLRACGSDRELFERLYDAGWKIIEFPGCITSDRRYIRWHKARAGTVYNNSACEGFGVTLRLDQAKSGLLEELQAFLSSRDFHQVLADKFEMDLSDSYYDGGIQKYLDGYEISPHPDIRSKKLTFMVNVNTANDSEQRDHHTHYLSFRPEYRYVQSYWQSNAKHDRAWVPWSWCETVEQQRANNSMVIFSPSNETLHAVRARYDHLAAQRTQLYGNLWYKDYPKLATPRWEDFVIEPENDVIAQGKEVIAKKLKRAWGRGQAVKTRLLGRDASSKLGRRAHS